MTLIRMSVFHVSLGVLFTVGCASHPPFPDSSLTGRILEVKVGDSLNPKDITAKPGDEVRWINTTGGPVDIYFVEPLNDRISCQKGFASSGWGYLFPGETSEPESIVVAMVQSNQSVSLCFATQGAYAYIARRETTPTGKTARITGSVTIE